MNMNSVIKDYQTIIPAAITGIVNILPLFGMVIIGFFAATGKSKTGE